MRRKLAEVINELCICPFCQFTNGTWDGVIEHMIKHHTDKEVWEMYPEWRNKY